MNDELTPLGRAERALQDSETRLQQVLDNSSAVVFAKDSQGRYLFVNREFERLARRPAARIIGRTDEEVFPPEIATRFRYNDLRVLQEKRAIEFEESGDFGEGMRTYLAAKFPLFDSAGLAYAVCGIATDITDRKRLEEALTSAALAVSQSEGESLYRELARYVATILGVDGAFIATFDPATACQMRVRAFHLDGRTRENFCYELPGTPCETVVGHGFRLYPARLSELFPGDLDFRKLGFDSYAGHPLTDPAGRHLGLISVVSRRGLENPAFVESVLRIFAVRINAELERVAAQDALRTSQASYREIFEASEDAIFVHDWDTGTILDANASACATYGYSRDELLRVRLADISSGVPPYTEAEGLRWIERARRDGGARFEWQRRSRDGTLHWDEVRLKAARIGGQPRVLAFTREITESKLREQELRQSEDRLRATVTAALDCIVVMDHHGRIIEFNPAAETCFGYPRSDVIGQRLSELMIPARYREAHERGMARYLAGGAGRFLGRRIEICAMRADGTEFPVELAIGVAEGMDGPIFIGYLQDISELKVAEDRRTRLEAQLRQAQKMQAIGQLTGGIAHDFNNLLTGIMGYVALASEREAAQADRRLTGYLAQAQRSCERARDLIQQMLMFSRGQRGNPRVLALPPLVEEAVAALRPTLPHTLALTADVAGAGAVPTVHADPLQVEQVVLNLCLNARDAVADAGEIHVAVRSLQAHGFVCAGCRSSVDGDFVELRVTDTGHGMAPEVVEHIFEPFFSTKESGKGTGMGLAMVHGIVHEYGGHVLVETTPGKGSSLRILWPAQDAALLESEPELTAGPSARRATRPTLAGSVLVVDDEASVGEFMRELLETWGLQATFVSNGQAALDIVAGSPARFDAVITDQCMPRLNGLQLAQALRAMRPELPVILYSGHGEGLARTDLEAAGVHTVLRKPVDPAALEAALRSALATRTPGG
jgi:PAS domain S-box-containing protein